MLGDLWKYAVLVLCVGVALEAMALAAGYVLASRGLIFATGDAEAFERYLAKRDPLLGWPAPTSYGSGELDRSGSRVIPRYPDPNVDRTCISVFGDSFTWGDEVDLADSYANVLSGLVGCRVANYGVPGYGTDQAYLRFKYRIHDESQIVVLGHWSEDVIRNVNRFRGFIAADAVVFKPRFRLERIGGLTLLPAPELTRDEFGEIDERADLLPHEYFLPGGPSGVTALRFPFTRSLLGLFSHYRLRAWVRGEPPYASFYDPAHASGALGITVEILKSFVRDARSRGQDPVVLLIPDHADIRQLREADSVSYAPLVAELERSGIRGPDVARRMLDHLGDRDPCVLFSRCPGHYNPEGYALLARIVYDHLVERDLVSRLRSPKAR